MGEQVRCLLRPPLIRFFPIYQSIAPWAHGGLRNAVAVKSKHVKNARERKDRLIDNDGDMQVNFPLPDTTIAQTDATPPCLEDGAQSLSDAFEVT